ncbi:hypothetical protein CLU81_1182 [Flavobacterium sp. 9]|nr:hypothetical protein CLU81_1182 [Flavobacterium sp. 9]
MTFIPVSSKITHSYCISAKAKDATKSDINYPIIKTNNTSQNGKHNL